MDLIAKYVFFEEGFDFVIEDNTEIYRTDMR